MSTQQESPSSETSDLPVLLICGAFGPELSPFADLRDSVVRVAGDILHRVDLLEVGIGNLNAALSLERYLVRTPVAEVLFVGSCGEYKRSGTSALPGVVFAREFFARDISVLAGQSRALPQIGASVQTEPGAVGSLLRMALSAPEAVVNCPESVSLVAISPDDLEAFASFPNAIFFENLEAYGLARVATDQRVPFAALLAVTNGVGPRGSEEWQQNFAGGASVVGKLIRQIVSTDG